MIAGAGWDQTQARLRWRYQSPSRVARFFHLVGGLSSQNFPTWSVDGRASVRF